MKRVLLTSALLVLPLTSVAADKEHSEGSHKIHEVMMDSAKKMPDMEMSGDTDHDFAKMMADHHRSGIKMAEIEIQNGKDKELVALAKKIKTSQQEELKVLEKHSKMSH